MESVKELMFSVAGALIFCAAVTLFLAFSGRVDGMSDCVQSTGNLDTSLAYVSAAEPEEPPVTYADVVSELFSDTLQYDIEIDGILYRKEEYNLARYDVSGLREASSYTRSCVYDADGNLEKVIYRSN